MVILPLDDEILQATVDAYLAHGSNQTHAAAALGMGRTTFQHRLKAAAKKGMLPITVPMPGFVISRAVTDADGNVQSIQQKPEPGEKFEIPEGMALRKVSAYTDPDGNIIGKWQIATEDKANTLAAIQAAVDAFKEDLPRIAPTKGPEHTNALLLNQYTITDLHLGMLAWGEETGNSDYDLKIAEQLVLDWFAAAIGMAPDSEVAILAQLGDFLHHDSLESVTPANKHVLDADSRLQKIIRVAIRVVRRVIAMLLERHKHVHVIMASANHDPAGSAWMREVFHAFYENEPRLTIDASPDIYYAYEWGKTALFYHHGHKRTIKDVDTVFAGKFREIYGRARQSYGHIGHKHSLEVKESNLMVVERHRTLAPPDAYGANWLSGRDAKVITYHREWGEVHRSTLSPQMVQA
jgi:hypothetical protein